MQKFHIWRCERNFKAIDSKNGIIRPNGNIKAENTSHTVREAENHYGLALEMENLLKVGLDPLEVIWITDENGAVLWIMTCGEQTAYEP